MENWARAMLAMNMMMPLMGPRWSSMNGIAIIPTPQLPCAHRGSNSLRTRLICSPCRSVALLLLGHHLLLVKQLHHADALVDLAPVEHEPEPTCTARVGGGRVIDV